MSWPTGDLPGNALVTVRFLIPTSDWLAKCIVGACNWLQYAESWDQVGTTVPAQAAAIFTASLKSVLVQNTMVGQVVAFPADNMQYLNRDPAQGSSQWRKCEGQSLVTTDFPYLFNVIGYTWGGSGSNFNLPDLRGRVLVDAGAGSGLSPRALTDEFGEETHTLSQGEMPSHSHSYNASLTLLTGTPPPLDAQAPNPLPGATGNTGGGGAHNNLQPSVVLIYYIQVVP